MDHVQQIIYAIVMQDTLVQCAKMWNALEFFQVTLLLCVQDLVRVMQQIVVFARVVTLDLIVNFSIALELVQHQTQLVAEKECVLLLILAFVLLDTLETVQ